MTNADLEARGGLKLAAADAFEILRDYFKERKGLGGPVDDRIVIRPARKSPAKPAGRNKK